MVKESLAALRSFFSRGREVQRRRLVQLLFYDQSQPQLNFILENPPANLASSLSSRRSPQVALSPITEISVSTSSTPHQYFQSPKFSELSSRRVKDLVKAATALKDADKTAVKDFAALWSCNSRPVFQQSSCDVYSRVDYLYNTRCELEAARTVLDCTNRFISLFVRHEVDSLISEEGSTLADAIERLQKRTKYKSISREYYSAANFVDIVELHGPGHLLRLGTGVNSMYVRYTTSKC